LHPFLERKHPLFPLLVQVEPDPAGGNICRYDSLTLHDGPDYTAPRFEDRLCDVNVAPETFIEQASRNAIYLHFRADGSVTRPGFIGLATVVTE